MYIECSKLPPCTAIELYLYLKSFSFLFLLLDATVVAATRTEALRNHEHRNLSSSSSSTATTATATSTAFCFLHQSIRLFFGFFVLGSVGRLVYFVCICLQSQSTEEADVAIAATHRSGVRSGNDCARTHILSYSHPPFSRDKCIRTHDRF